MPAQTNLKPVYGPQAVARFWSFWLNAERPNQQPLSLTQAEINGSPAILFWDEGRLVIVLSLALSEAGIAEIFALMSPEKLAYLQNQLASSPAPARLEP